MPPNDWDEFGEEGFSEYGVPAEDEENGWDDEWPDDDERFYGHVCD